MLIFSSPCNPTGSVYTKEELKAIADVIGENGNILIVSDEIYEYITFAGKHESIGAFENVRENTATVNGFSKGFSMTGWRLGYMGGPKWLSDACNKVQGQITSGAASFSQEAAAVALRSDRSETIAMKEAFYSRRDLVINGLKEIPGFKSKSTTGSILCLSRCESLLWLYQWEM